MATPTTDADPSAARTAVRRGPRRLHLVALTVLSLALVGTALGDLTRNPAVMVDLAQLGYPDYVATIVGAAKLLAVVVLWAPPLRGLREWAYAGLVFDFGLAIVSHLAIGSFDRDAILACAYLTATLLVRWLGRRADRLQVTA